ncbi:ferredoxin [Candidatus Parcubacteria bacterium]|nr:ferredoxin [Patescibacteria group bacterium]MBU4309944.1 ferredoxin [Patescibacteria group bacterium]MBU4432254.1 ferredoxin [Patescibacteria group bacterium]MBU4577869.1 ferredoxin [Patescibacteria group bacterium]MCG2696930.1 ferredoxin [Candidatus Parcubacteria bacterium]
MNKQRLLLIFILIFLSNITSGCVIDNNSNKEQVRSKNVDGKTVGYDKTLSKNIAVKKVTILDGCIGCGVCAKIDREHFVIAAHRAKVISQNNLEAPLLTAAIKNCPTAVIALN